MFTQKWPNHLKAPHDYRRSLAPCLVQWLMGCPMHMSQSDGRASWIDLLLGICFSSHFIPGSFGTLHMFCAITSLFFLLDELMGVNRNLDNEEGVIDDFRDERVCKAFLCGLCPHDLFRCVISLCAHPTYRSMHDGCSQHIVSYNSRRLLFGTVFFFTVVTGRRSILTSVCVRTNIIPRFLAQLVHFVIQLCSGPNLIQRQHQETTCTRASPCGYETPGEVDHISFGWSGGGAETDDRV